MHDPYTHFMITRGLFPSLNSSTIYKVNKALDNPSIPSMAMNRVVRDNYKSRGYTKNPFDMFNLARGGHRSRNHDILTGMLTSYGAAGTQGLYAMLGHYFADSYSNILLENMGSSGRNLFESLMLHTNRNRRYY